MSLFLVFLLVPVMAFGQSSGWNDDFFNDLRGRGDSWFNGNSSSDDGWNDNGRNSTSRSWPTNRPTASQGQVKESRKPWSGDWWPRGPAGLAFKNTGGGLSPFEKFDSIVYDNFGRVAGAAAWEADPANQHNTAPQGGENWAGHCNGLAAASILTRQPVRSVRVPLQ